MPPGGAPENLIPCKPGHTANPNGRPKGTKNRTTIYSEILNQRADRLKMPKIKELMETLGVEKGITLGELIALKNSTMALNANKLGLDASTHVEDSAHGKITQKTEITGADGEALMKEQLSEQFKKLSVEQMKKIKAIMDEAK